MGETKRLWFDKIDTIGAFPDRRIRLDVIFTDQEKEKYIWTARWNEVLDLYFNAKKTEETNKPDSIWIKKFEEYEGKMESYEERVGTVSGMKDGKMVLISGWEEFEHLEFKSIPSINWFKKYYNCKVRTIIVNGKVYEILDSEGKTIYP